MKIKNSFIFLALALITSSCSTQHKRMDFENTKNMKIVIDKSTNNSPEWVNDSKIFKVEEENYFYVSRETVLGDQRVSGCFEMASFDIKNKIVREIGEEIKGAIDQAIPELSENSESVFTKLSSSKWNGKIFGVSNDSEYFERYRIYDGGNLDTYKERIDCFVRMKISKSDHSKMKKILVDEVKKLDPQIKEALLKKQIDFFSKE